MRDDVLNLIRRIRIIPAPPTLHSELAGLASQRQVGRPLRVGFVNAHALNLCYSNAAFRQNLLDCDLLYRDGIGMKILCRMLGMEAGLNMNGTDFIPRILKAYAGREVALLGTESPYLDNAAQAVEELGPVVTVTMDGFRHDAAYVEAVTAAAPAVVVLAMGMPKQERVAAALAQHCPYPCLIICGGAILDFMGGKVTRAPLAFRRFGMEWLYRLFREPKRLFRRYVIGNAVFLLRGLRLAAKA